MDAGVRLPLRRSSRGAFFSGDGASLRRFLKEISNAQYSAMTKAFWARRQSRKCLLRSLNVIEDPFPDCDLSYPDFLSGAPDCSDGYASPWKLGQNDKEWTRALSICEHAWEFTQQKQNLVLGKALWLRVRELLHCVVLGFAEDLRTAPCVVMHLDRLLRFVSHEEARWMTRRAMVAMHMAETNGKQFFLGLDFVVALQRAYTTGRLDLNSLCFLMDVNIESVQYRTVSLLPDCQGRCNVPIVETDMLRLRRSCEEKVPWLRILWRRLLEKGRAASLQEASSQPRSCRKQPSFSRRGTPTSSLLTRANCRAACRIYWRASTRPSRPLKFRRRSWLWQSSGFSFGQIQLAP